MRPPRSTSTPVSPAAGSSTRRRLRLPRHRSTTANLCAVYPAVVQAPLPRVGPLLGADLTAGGAGLHWDPFELYTHGGIVTNPNVFIMGEPGYAKSSLVKCWAVWSTYLYGDHRWITITDPKGEYRALAELLGLSVLRIAPGGNTRINPLEHPGTLTGSALDAERDVQTTMIAALAATQLARPLTPLERKVVRAVIATITAHRRQRSATLPGLVRLLESPTGELLTATHRDVDAFVRDTEHLRYALDELCTGPLRGMFDGPTNTSVAWDGPGMVMDLSGVIGDSRAMALVMVAAIGWTRQQRHHHARRHTIAINDESYYMYKQSETVEYAQERRKLGRQHGEANIDICHRPSDLSAQADDGSRVAKMAAGLLADSAMKIVFRQAASEIAAATEMIGLTASEQDCIRRLGRGRALWKLGDRSLLAEHYRPAFLRSATDTDAMMRRASLVTDHDADTGA